MDQQAIKYLLIPEMAKLGKKFLKLPFSMINNDNE